MYYYDTTFSTCQYDIFIMLVWPSQPLIKPSLCRILFFTFSNCEYDKIMFPLRPYQSDIKVFSSLVLVYPSLPASVIALICYSSANFPAIEWTFQLAIMTKTYLHAPLGEHAGLQGAHQPRPHHRHHLLPLVLLASHGSFLPIAWTYISGPIAKRVRSPFPPPLTRGSTTVVEWFTSDRVSGVGEE